MKKIKQIINKNIFKISIVSICLLIVSWYSHVISTILNDPLGLTFDFIVGVPLPYILKIIVLFSIVILYFKIIPLLNKNTRLSITYFISGFLLSLIIIIILSILRNDIAHIFNNSTIRYNYFLKDGSIPQNLGGQIQEWLDKWFKGIIFIQEVVFTFLIFLFNTLIGYFFGNRKKLSPIIALLGNLLLLIIYNLIFGLVSLDYDWFYGDIYTGVLLYDLILCLIPIPPMYLFTSINILFYLNIIIISNIVYILNKKDSNRTITSYNSQ